MRSERLTLQITPDEKAKLSAAAERLGLTVSDVVRLAVDAFDVQGAERLLEDVADEIDAAVQRANQRLDETHEFVQDILRDLQSQRDERPGKAAA